MVPIATCTTILIANNRTPHYQFPPDSLPSDFCECGLVFFLFSPFLRDTNSCVQSERAKLARKEHDFASGSASDVFLRRPKVALAFSLGWNSPGSQQLTHLRIIDLCSFASPQKRLGIYRARTLSPFARNVRDGILIRMNNRAAATSHMWGHWMLIRLSFCIYANLCSGLLHSPLRSHRGQ